MRFFMNPRAVITVLAAAVATPLIVKSAKPFAKKIGQEFEKLGKKLVESVETMENEEEKARATEPHKHGPGATPDETPTESPDPRKGAETHVPDPTEVPAEPTEPARTTVPDPNESPAETPDEVPPSVTQPNQATASTKVKATKPAPKKKATKSTSKTVKAKRTTARRKPRDIGETG